VAGGVGSRFIDIVWESVPNEVNPTADQIFFTGCTISNTKSDGNGGFAYVSADKFWMNI
jgi:hypothetical protein